MVMTNNKRHFLPNRPILRSMLLSGFILGAFALLGTGMVVWIHALSADQIRANIQQSLLNSLNTIIDPKTYDNDLLQSHIEVGPDPLLGKNKENTTVYQAKLGDKAVALAFDVIAPDGYGGKIKLIIAIKTDGSISGVRVIDHKETPGLGDNIDISHSDWITGFRHKSLQNTTEIQWHVKKDGGIFDQFSGATITPRAVVKAVYRALLYYHKYQKVLFLDQARYQQQSQKSVNVSKKRKNQHKKVF